MKSAPTRPQHDHIQPHNKSATSLVDLDVVRFKYKSFQETSTTGATKFPTTSQSSSTSSPQIEITVDSDVLKQYLRAFYFSTKIMTLVSEMPNPHTSVDYLFSIIQLIAALLLFATIMGHVGYIVSNLGNARKEFQCTLFFYFIFTIKYRNVILSSLSSYKF